MNLPESSPRQLSTGLAARLRALFPSGSLPLGERLLGLAFLLAGGLLLGLGYALTPTTLGLLGGIWLLCLIVVARLGWLPLLGPVFFSEFVRASRRGRHSVLRLGYAIGLFLFLLALYRNYSSLTNVTFLGGAGMARFAETFCLTFLAAQFLAVGLLTPAYLAGGIAEEKERKTLEFLLATEVRNREIIFGKLVARLLSLGMLVLTGLPILSLMQLWGGIDASVLLQSFAATAVTALCLATVSLLCSVHARTAREAIVLTYLAIAGYLGLTTVLHLVVSTGGIGTTVLWTTSSTTWTVDDLAGWFNGGNAGLLCYHLSEDVVAGIALPTSLPVRLQTYAIVLLTITGFSLVWSVLRVRGLALQDTHDRATTRTALLPSRWRARPGKRPLHWKEIWTEGGLSFNAFGKAIIVLIVLVSFLPALWLGGRFLLDSFKATGQVVGTWGWWDRLGDAVNTWVRIVGTLVASLTLFGVAVRAASAISGERDRQSLDNLLTVPREAGEFLRAKWWGSVLSVRSAWIWLGLVWLLGSATGGLYLPTVPWILLAWFVYAGFLASLGIWFSLVCKTTLRATVWTLATTIALGLGHWYVWMVVFMPLALRSEFLAFVVMFEKYALTPPLALAWFSFRENEVHSLDFFQSSQSDPAHIFLCFLAGLLIWGLAGLVVWWRALRRFRALSGREPRVPVAAPPLPVQSSATDIAEVSPSPARSRRRGILVVALVLFGVGLVSWYTYLTSRAERRLSDALAETSSRDLHWRLHEIEAQRQHLAPDNNSVPQIAAARGQIPVWGWPQTQEKFNREELQPNQRLTLEQVRHLIDALEQVEDVFPDLQNLENLPRGRHAVAYSPDFIGTLLRHVDMMTYVSTVLWFQMALGADCGDVEGALTVARRMGNLWRSLGDEPMMVSQQVRNSRGREFCRAVQRVLAHGVASDASLTAIQRWLEEEERHPGLVVGARGERAGLDQLMSRIVSNEVPLSNLRWLGWDRKEKGETVMDWVQLVVTPGAEKESRAALLQYFNRFIEAAEQPLEDQEAHFGEVAALRPTLPILARELAPTIATAEFHLALKTELRCLQVAIGAERFRLARGRWPTTLQELIPGQLAEVPQDPYARSALLLKRLDDGLVIYSIGPNHQDDGGDVNVRAGQQLGKDIGARLWDVAHRVTPRGELDIPAKEGR